MRNGEASKLKKIILDLPIGRSYIDNRVKRQVSTNFNNQLSHGLYQEWGIIKSEHGV